MSSLSEKFFNEALAIFPGGVNSPVRAFKAVGGKPPFIRKAKGPFVWDVDGKQYIDYVGSWGPAILGHADPKVVAAVQAAAADGFSFGAPTELEVRLAEKVCQAFPSMEKMRFVNSGTEATMSAIRLARAFTHRDKILKFEGCYHGHADYLLVNAGSGGATFGVPSSAGVPADFTKHTLSVPYNDFDSAEKLFQKQGKEIAAVILEPVVGNNGVILPKENFLSNLKKLCSRYETILIFDEVMTGFRVAFGGAQSLYGINPDMTCLGKVIGGGLPVGAYGGKKEIMDQVAPLGPAYQAGTLSGNPLAMTAGIATLQQLSASGIYDRLKEKTDQLVEGILEVAKSKKIDLQVPNVCGMFSLLFKKNHVENFNKIFHPCLKNGIYFPPSAFEACFVSLAHSEKELKKTIEILSLSFSFL